jgi:hypothetical protein
MSARTDWEGANSRFLTTALAELRLRLELQANRSDVVGAPVHSRIGAGMSDGPVSAMSVEAVRVEPEGATNADSIRAAVEATAAAEAATTPVPALGVLIERLGLSAFERQVLLLCAAMELDTRIAGLCARAQGDPARAYPTFALAMVVFDSPEWAALAPDSPLRFWRLLEITQPAAEPLTTSPLRADERIVSFLKGLNYLDDRIQPLLVPFDDANDEPELPASQQAVVTQIVDSIHRRDQAPVVQLAGPDGTSKRLVARAAARALGLHLQRMPAALLPTTAGELEQIARLWQREAMLLPLALYVETDPESIRNSAVDRFLARTGGVAFLDATDARPDLRRRIITVEVTRPTTAEQRAAWSAAVPAADRATTARLASQFDLDLLSIRRVADEASGTGDPVPLRQRLWEACLRATEPHPGSLAQRITPQMRWEQLVLPEDELDLLRSLSSQVRRRARVYDDWGFRTVMSRGFGITALFAGPSGTGKTMAAEVIANHLRLGLYRIDLSAVVSKYIGETEKNLRKLFDEFEAGGALLFFDEADALFGKRTAVRDSHDRYANIEVNYLLQRMESYRGLAILATNTKGALDPAFLRRLRFIVDFPFPDAEQRRRIWTGALPKQTPCERGLELDRLARLNLSGGSIHNVALDAAFRAAEAGTKVTMPLLLAAARSEFRKLGLPFRESEFRWATPREAVVA